VLALALAAVLACLSVSAVGAQAGELDVLSFSAPGLEADQSPSITAGARPFELINSFALSERKAPSGAAGPSENLKDLSFDLPPGIVGNAASVPTCTHVQFELEANGSACPEGSQVGTATLKVTFFKVGDTISVPVYNLVPPPGVPAQFGFVVVASYVHVNFHVRTGSDYGVTATLHNVSNTAPLFQSTVRIWGVPGDPAHDEKRVPCFYSGGSCPYPEPEVEPFLSNPTSCAHRPLLNTMEVTTWQLPNETTFAIPYEADPMKSCGELDFAPTIAAKPTTNLGDSPTGLDIHLQIPQNQDPAGRATAHLQESKVVLPPSLTVNPSSANGRGACDLSQIGYTGLASEQQSLTYSLRTTGSFLVSSGGQTTAPIPARATRAQVMGAIETLAGLAGNVSLEGSPGAWNITFIGALAGSEVSGLSGEVAVNSIQSIDLTGSGGGYFLNFEGTNAGAGFEASFGAGESRITVSSSSRPLKVGDQIEGPGIAPGTMITGFFLGISSLPELSNPTTEAQTGVHLKTELLFNASAAEIQTALAEVPALGENNVFVTATGSSGDTRSFQVLFTGDLAGTEPALLTQTNSLTGPGAGVTITQDPPSTGPLHVATTYEAGNPQFTPDPANCPDASKLGTVEIESPAVIDHPLKGSVYLATPHQNPFNSLLAIYITVDDPASGVVVKLPGLVEADPNTGQLTATVSEAPQLPFEDLTLEFLKGALAPLKTGIACGSYDIATEMVPWSSPEGATMHPGDSFQITKGAGEGPCVKDEASAPNTPGFEAGTVNTTAGAYSPFVLKLTRADGTQQLTGIDTTLPKGLIAKLAGVQSCSEAALAAAAGHSGKAEQANPSCPEASKLGTVSVGAGAGPKPFYASGTAYLAGPYKGAPLSLAVITPAVAGPFDLGTVVIRNALHIDPETAVVRAVSDPFPSILQGIPLDLRSVVVSLDRSRFIKNPTNCSPFAITGAATALSGQKAPLDNRFQVGDCPKLRFAPKLKLSLKGGTRRSDHPALKAVLSAKEGEANIARTSVALPHSEFLAQNHIKTICTRVQFAADQCPKGSIYGHATATTPLLDQPLTGPVYLRSSNNPLPDLVAALKGPAERPVEVDLVGRIDSFKGGIRTTFAAVPDAPVSRFVLQMQGGRKGLLENSKNLCSSTNRATVQMDGQNGKTYDTRPVLANGCKQGKGKKRAKRHGR
jgi:hypothetical protein